MTASAQVATGARIQTIALAGQPNTGKSTVFNQLTGARQHVGNWPGKTVEQKRGTYVYEGTMYDVVDLPGTYSLTANSLEETIARDFVLEERPDVVVVLLDAAQLERTMYLLAEVMQLSVPVVAVLNMMDVAEKEGRRIDVAALERRLGVPVVPMVAAKRQGVPELLAAIDRLASGSDGHAHNTPNLVGGVQQALAQVESLVAPYLPEGYPLGWVALKILEGDAGVADLMRGRLPAASRKILDDVLSRNDDGPLVVAGARYTWVGQVLDEVVERGAAQEMGTRRSRFDRLATHPVWGVPIAIGVTLLAFAAAMVLAAPLMMGAMGALPALIEATRQALAGAPAWVGAMLADGLLPGVGMALAYLGFLMGVFLAIGFVEDVGYMARAAYVADRFMVRIGLHGKSFLPMFTSLGCNITGVLGSRVVDSWQQRMMTMVMAPIVPCLAVWTVVGFFGTMFFGAAAPLVTVALLLALVGWLAWTGFLFRRLFVRGEPEGMIMELPPYHRPNWRTIWRFTWMHTRSFLARGVTLVAGAALVIWALSYLPNGEIESSLLARAGRSVEWIGALMGLDWRLMVALLSSMAAKETALATLGVLYGIPAGAAGTSVTGLILGAEALEQSAIASALQSAISPASALAFVFAVFFSVPCLGTLGAIYSESKSWKWTLGATAYYILATFIAGFLAYRAGLLLF